MSEGLKETTEVNVTSWSHDSECNACWFRWTPDNSLFSLSLEWWTVSWSQTHLPPSSLSLLSCNVSKTVHIRVDVQVNFASDDQQLGLTVWKQDVWTKAKKKKKKHVQFREQQPGRQLQETGKSLTVQIVLTVLVPSHTHTFTIWPLCDSGTDTVTTCSAGSPYSGNLIHISQVSLSLLFLSFFPSSVHLNSPSMSSDVSLQRVSELLKRGSTAQWHFL